MVFNESFISSQNIQFLVAYYTSNTTAQRNKEQKSNYDILLCMNSDSNTSNQYVFPANENSLIPKKANCFVKQTI